MKTKRMFEYVFSIGLLLLMVIYMISGLMKDARYELFHIIVWDVLIVYAIRDILVHVLRIMEDSEEIDVTYIILLSLQLIISTIMVILISSWINITIISILIGIFMLGILFLRIMEKVSNRD